MRFRFTLDLVRVITLAVLICFSLTSRTSDQFIIVASTTSTENSGLYTYLLPHFTQQTDIEVRVVAVGTGQAILIARNGDADVLLVHHRPSEERFVLEGFGVTRHDLMYNDYIIVGPSSDPATVQSTSSVAEAVTRIAVSKSLFLSRGDDSGTHKKELHLWRLANVAVEDASGDWYLESGRGMGGTLNMASAMNAYTLSDRATWLKFGNKGELGILFQGDPPLFNPYSIILVNPEMHPHIRAKEGQAFIDWMLSETGQNLIGKYRILGHQAFFPTARR